MPSRRFIAWALPLALLAGCSWLGERIRDENDYRVARALNSAETRALAEEFSPIGLRIFFTPLEASGRRELLDYERELVHALQARLEAVGFTVADTRLFVRREDPKIFAQHKPWGEKTVRATLAEHPDWKGVALLTVEEERGRPRIVQGPETLDVAGLHIGGIQPPLIVRGEIGFFVRSPHRRGVVYAKWEKKFDGAYSVVVPKEAREGEPFEDFSKVKIVRRGRNEELPPPALGAEELKMPLEDQWRIASFRVFAGDVFAHLDDRPLRSPASRELGLESDIAPY